MKKYKTYIVIICVMLSIALYIIHVLLFAGRNMKTRDTMGRISVTLGHSLGEEAVPLSQYDPVKEYIKRFPYDDDIKTGNSLMVGKMA